MNILKMTGGVLFLAVLVTTCMQGLTTTFGPAAPRRSRLLLIGSANTETSRRMIEGARAAADELGVDLAVQIADSSNPIPNQAELLQHLHPERYDGIAFLPRDSESQFELINNLARHTKLVTLHRDCVESNRLCYYGYSQTNAGSLAARLVGERMLRSGKVAVLSTPHSDPVASEEMRQRLAGFRDSWTLYDYRATCGPVVELTIGAASLQPNSSGLATMLADPDVGFIVALDLQSAELTLAAQATMPAPRRVPMLTFDPNDKICDAIQQGRISLAIFSDPYFSGFTAIERLAYFCHGDPYSIPVPGRGSYFLVSEVVSKQNLAEVRRRMRS
jgi:ABC-type sugar transport system substrate-binding protein